MGTGNSPTPATRKPTKYAIFPMRTVIRISIWESRAVRRVRRPMSSTGLILDLTNQNAFDIAGYLPYGGDANNDNRIDGADFGSLVNVYNDVYDVGDPGASPDDIQADFNGDGYLDGGDFGILVNGY